MDFQIDKDKSQNSKFAELVTRKGVYGDKENPLWLVTAAQVLVMDITDF